MSCPFHSGLFVCSRTLYAVLAEQCYVAGLRLDITFRLCVIYMEEERGGWAFGIIGVRHEAGVDSALQFDTRLSES